VIGSLAVLAQDQSFDLSGGLCVIDIANPLARW
jgi:hypothetical protein